MKDLSPPSIVLSGVGSYAPPRILTNDDLSKIVDTTDEWIRTRTGILERRIADEEETCSDMAAKAAKAAIEDAGLQPSDIGCIIVATITPDMPFPSTACLVGDKLGLPGVPAFDVEAACSGFIYIMEIARAMIAAGTCKHAVIIGAEKLSSIVDWTDRTTCVLFGDGAGAAVLSRSDEPDTGIVGSLLGADGAEGELLFMPGGGSSCPATHESIEARSHYLKMYGKGVFKHAVRVMEQSAVEILHRFDVSPDELSVVIPHQANQRIIESIANRLGLGLDRFKINLDRFGNTSAASIPLALDEALRNHRVKHNDLILMVAFGAGLTWASALLRWHRPTSRAPRVSDDEIL